MAASGRKSKNVRDGELKYDLEDQPVDFPPKKNSITLDLNQFAERFLENPEYLLDKLEYERKGKEAARVLIFLQEKFEVELPERPYSVKDVDSLYTCLTRLGINIDKEKHIFRDRTKEEIFEAVDKILSEESLAEVNSVMVFVLTHGNDSNVLYSKNGPFSSDDLCQKFIDCKVLDGKPKAFVFQACKGERDTNLLTPEKDSLLVPPSMFLQKNIHKDVIKFFSTMEERFSYSHIDKGSWLIQELCRNFTAYGRRDDVFTLLTRVVKCVSSNYYEFHEGKGEIFKEVPVIVSTLTKKFYLCKNKDRHYFLTLMQKHEELLELAKRISEKVNNLEKAN